MGHTYLFTGEGAGKTTNALGLALRSVGHKNKVIVIQFLKWWKETGEYKAGEILKPYYEIYQFGRSGWIGFDNLTEEDKELCKKALKFALEIVGTKKPNLLILDEINLALYLKLLSLEEVFNCLNQIMDISKETDVVLTGRFAPQELIDKVDFVNEIIDVKHPDKIPTTRGVQY
ncbi:MAG: cob(I)yrinic acid a,c-diamide adenosyltransferase [Actinobacteria bacterium]|nr:cob(I)yrinic acid a,c-diamide adenosyltransferase [Actinomycetota bacterium]